MDSWSETSWFAIQAKPFRENLAAGALAEFDVEVFLPRIRQEQSVCGALRVVAKPLFAGYFFARFNPVLLLETVRYAKGVVRVVGTSQFPVAIEPAIIQCIRERVQDDGFVHLERRSFRPGDKVSIDRGPFAGWMGKVERECDDRKRVLILLEAIHEGRLLIESRWIAAVPVRA
jgi:transcription antitermination factor NusG